MGLLAVSVAAGGCGGGGNGSAAAPLTASFTVTPTALSFAGVGTTFAQSVIVSGVVPALVNLTNDTCDGGGVATIQLASSGATSGTFAVTPISPGTCSAVFAVGSSGKTLTVTVTSTPLTVE